MLLVDISVEPPTTASEGTTEIKPSFPFQRLLGSLIGIVLLFEHKVGNGTTPTDLSSVLHSVTL